jgi:hypothetical protein
VMPTEKELKERAKQMREENFMPAE